MTNDKVLCGLKFKFESQDKLWNQTYRERWVCDIGHFEIVIFNEPLELQGYQCVVSYSNGFLRAEGETLEQALSNALMAMSEEVAKDKRHTDWLRKGCPQPPPEGGIFGSWTSGITYWEEELAAAKSGKMSKLRKTTIRNNLFYGIGLAIFFGSLVYAAFDLGTK